ncbi:MAG: hypothetical protein A2820_00645 [Candidatus Buchananbacteria bacterium RIFCSPHIGHO2_01_FULL_40_35]|nr:MAG: hypothetical protein A2820_00645 [Candidatus Buchananbacteria bacterium RIFCSPHIGHO2_01_FULL_40_35]
MMVNQKTIFFILLSIFYFLFSFPTFAAQFFLGAPAQEIAVDSTFTVGVFVDSQGQDVNALEGDIVFPSEYLTLRSIDDSNSLVSLWLKRPEVNVDDSVNKVPFSGIVPGGYRGEKGYLFSLIFTAQKAGQITISSANDKIFLNDSLGTAASISWAPLNLKISSTAAKQDYLPPPDNKPPEPFTPLLTRDPNLFNNQWFLVFATQDKGSGLNHYEVAERREFKIFNFKFGWGDYLMADSPYLLKDQKLKSQIYVRAVDENGNQRLATVLAAQSFKLQGNYLIYVIIILVIIAFIILFCKRLWKRELTHQ